jgi:hypothetical protein
MSVLFEIMGSRKEALKRLRTYSVLGELGDVVEDELVGVSLLVEILLLVVGHDGADDLGHGVVELGVTPELLALLCVLVLICHYDDGGYLVVVKALS